MNSSIHFHNYLLLKKRCILFMVTLFLCSLNGSSKAAATSSTLSQSTSSSGSSSSISSLSPSKEHQKKMTEQLTAAVRMKQPTHKEPAIVTTSNIAKYVKLPVYIPEDTQKVINNLIEAIKDGATIVTQGSAQLHKLLYNFDQLKSVAYKIDNYIKEYSSLMALNSSLSSTPKDGKETKERKEEKEKRESEESEEISLDNYLYQTPISFIHLLHVKFNEINDNFIEISSIYNLGIPETQSSTRSSPSPSTPSTPSTSFQEVATPLIKLDQNIVQLFIKIGVDFFMIIDGINPRVNQKNTHDTLIATQKKLKAMLLNFKLLIQEFQKSSLGGAYGTIQESIEVLKSKLLDVSDDVAENLSVRLRKQLAENVGFPALLSMQQDINRFLEANTIDTEKLEELRSSVWQTHLETIIDSIKHPKKQNATQFERRINTLLLHLKDLSFVGTSDQQIRLELRRLLKEVSELNSANGGLLSTLQSTTENLSVKLRKQLLEVVGFSALFYIHRDISQILSNARSIMCNTDFKDILHGWRKSIRKIKTNIAHDTSAHATQLEKDLTTLLDLLKNEHFDGKNDKKIREKLIKIQKKLNVINTSNGGLFINLKNALDESMATFSNNLRAIVKDDLMATGKELTHYAFHHAKRTALFAGSIALAVNGIRHYMKNTENPQARKIGVRVIALALLYPLYEGARSLWSWIKGKK